MVSSSPRLNISNRIVETFEYRLIKHQPNIIKSHENGRSDPYVSLLSAVAVLEFSNRLGHYNVLIDDVANIGVDSHQQSSGTCQDIHNT